MNPKAVKPQGRQYLTSGLTPDQQACLVFVTFQKSGVVFRFTEEVIKFYFRHHNSRYRNMSRDDAIDLIIASLPTPEYLVQSVKQTCDEFFVNLATLFIRKADNLQFERIA
jgi:hypothetical protein